jgi:hypothetical protein
VAYVVRDIEKCMQHWAHVLGVGPWFYREQTGITEFSYYGKPVDPLPELSIALANSGSLQIELIQQRNATSSLYRDFLNQRGEGAQHVAYWTEDFCSTVRQLLGAGYVEGHAGRMGVRGRFSYLMTEDFPAGVIEISELSGGKAEYFRAVADASSKWDGSDPIRRSDPTASVPGMPRIAIK